MTTDQVAWLSVTTPDLAWSTEGELEVEANTSLGAWPSSFQPITLSAAAFITGGYVGSGGSVLPLSGLAYFGLASQENTLWQVISGASVTEDWSQNSVTVNP
jgi:hypothetical protein